MNFENATTQQVQAIQKLAARAGMKDNDLAIEIQEIFGKTLAELDKSEAGQLIKILQGQMV